MSVTLITSRQRAFKTVMVPKVFEIFDNPDHPLLGPNIFGLKCWGLLQPNRFSKYFYNTVHTLACLFVLRQYIELWIIRTDFHQALRNLSVTMLSSVCVFKAVAFVVWQKSWKELIEFVSNLEKDQLSQRDPTTKKIIANYTSYSRKITLFYWCLVIATVSTFILAPCIGFMMSSFDHVSNNGTVTYPEIISSWLPFDKTKGYGYWIAYAEHSLICVYGGGVVASYDSNAVVLMMFFDGQLKVLTENCARLFGDGFEAVGYEEAMRRIKYCHIHHLNLIRYSKILNALQSPAMFMYVIICSLMICASAFQLTMEGTMNVQRVWVAEYLVALIFQLFLYCWHCNEVLFMSNKVNYGVYLSAWWSQNVRTRRSVLILIGQLRKPIVFTAGPFTQLKVATFVTILKGSYSFYTLLRKKEA